MVIVEGVGAGRREFEHLVDGLAWVQSDAVESLRRGIQRDGGTPAAAQEVRFLADRHSGDTPRHNGEMIVETSTQ